MSGSFRPGTSALFAAILATLLATSVTACQGVASNSASTKQTPTSTPTSTPTPTTTVGLTPCPVVANWPVKPLTADVLAAVTKYYTEKQLAPITIYKNQETILDIKEQSVGVHYCQNPGDGIGGYTGAVPLTAIAAVMVYVKHEPYPGTGAPSHFVTLAQMPGIGWTVVGEGTGP